MSFITRGRTLISPIARRARLRMIRVLNGLDYIVLARRQFTTSKSSRMRLPYIPDDPAFSALDDQAVVSRVRERRGGKLLALDKALLHAPPVADGWNGFLKAIRTQTTLPASVRELAICRVAVLNQAWYEWDHHRPLLQETGMLSEKAIDYVKTRSRTSQTSSKETSDDKAETILDEKHRTVLEYTDAMTIGCIVPDQLFQKIKEMFSDREIVEITSTVAAYNCVSRFLVALDVGEMAKEYNVDMSGGVTP